MRFWRCGKCMIKFNITRFTRSRGGETKPCDNPGCPHVFRVHAVGHTMSEIELITKKPNAVILGG